MKALRRIFHFILCLGVLILLASCAQPKQAQEPAESTSAGETASTNPASENTSPALEDSASANGILADPAGGLTELTGYQAFLQQDVSGTLEGQPYERHTRMELTRQVSSGDYDFNLEVSGSEMQAFAVRLLAQRQAYYRWRQNSDECQGSVQAPSADEVIEPSELLLPVLGGEKLGAETVNRIPCVHYRFDQDDLPIEKGSTVSGEVWIAEQGGYVVKYTLTSPLPEKITGKDLETSQTWAYELVPLEEGQGILLPEGCMAVPVDIPVFADAQDVAQGGGRLSFTSASAANKVLDFYLAELPALGWVPPETLPEGELTLPFLIDFSKGDQRLTMTLNENDRGSMDVDLLITTIEVNADALAGETEEAPAGTPAPAPTIDPAQSGLPEDIPLCSGATSLIRNNEMVMFTCPDARDAVADFYSEQMEAIGWVVSNEMITEVVVMRVWTKDGTTVSMTVVAQEGKTSVIVQVQ